MAVETYIACDPGAHAGLALCHGGGVLESHQLIINSFRGAQRMREVFDSMAAAEARPVRLVVEAQYPRPGRSYQSIFGLAAYRGAFEHEARLHRMEVVRVQPQEWKLPVLRSLGVGWRADPEDKDAVLVARAAQLVKRSVGPDEACAIMLGHWHGARGLYL